MASKRVRRRKREAIVTTRQTPWNATKAQAKQFAKERKLRGRIHQLEQELAAAKRAEADAIVTANEEKRLRLAAVPSRKQYMALKAFAGLPASMLVQFGMVDHGIELARWVVDLGRQAAADDISRLLHESEMESS